MRTNNILFIVLIVSTLSASTCLAVQWQTLQNDDGNYLSAGVAQYIHCNTVGPVPAGGPWYIHYFEAYIHDDIAGKTLAFDIYTHDTNTGAPTDPPVSLLANPIEYTSTGSSGWVYVSTGVGIPVAEGTILHPGSEYGFWDGTNAVTIALDSTTCGSGECYWYDYPSSGWNDWDGVQGRSMIRLLLTNQLSIESASLGEIKAAFK